MLIGLHGRKRAGKDTVYERARHIMADVLPVERLGFADLIYASAAAALGVTVADLREWKADPLVRVTVSRPWAVGPPSVHADITLREYLQRYGTEAHRDVFGLDFWVDRVDLSHEGRLLMVTDVRFENEARAIRAWGGDVVQVVGPRGVERSGDGHESEKPLPHELVDFVLPNGVRDDGFRALDRNVNTLLRMLLREKA